LIGTDHGCVQAVTMALPNDTEVLKRMLVRSQAELLVEELES
jgi:hypothetical protein